MEYLLKKISSAMSQEWDGKPLEDLMLQDAEERVREEGMSVWSFLEHVGAGRLLRVTSAEAFSLALDEVFLEMYHNVLKRVSSTFPSSSPSCHLCSASSLIALLAFCFQGYMWKKGHVRRNWTERWFVLKPSTMDYYVGEDLKEKRGEMQLDKNCVVEVGGGLRLKYFTLSHAGFPVSHNVMQLIHPATFAFSHLVTLASQMCHVFWV